MAFGAIKLVLFDHMHGFDPCNEFSCAMELFGFCRNKELKTRCQVGVLRGLDSQAVELVSSGRNLTFGAIKLPLFEVLSQ
jgi:hypothetical protein